MDFRILCSMLSMMYSGILHAVSSVPMEEDTAASTTATPVPVHHIRNKRCSCATFLDKECVYFCHLDIIWVNTPERVVSYGLGNASRKKRAIKNPAISKQDPRCKCVHEDDSTCTNFCQLDIYLRYNMLYNISPITLVKTCQITLCISANTSLQPKRVGLKGKKRIPQVYLLNKWTL
uniref:Endothelin-1 n=1 Tax=Oncorhynchus mykiss TaxID=8022 RepID=A0A8K9UF38_ONCMY